MIFKVGRLLKAANAARLTVYLIALWKLFKHPQTPRHAKLFAVLVLAYALSPIDLIPDFIPVLGQLDDVILVPLGIALVVKMTPKPLWEQLLREAEDSRERMPSLKWGRRHRRRDLAARDGAAGVGRREAVRRMTRLLVGLLLAWGGAAQAWSGVVTHVSDGDTLWVRPAQGKPVKVRLVGIDAPERCQAWGTQSQSALSAKVLHRTVELEVRARDDYQRLLATVQLRDENINAWLVAQGHAWSAHYRRSLGPYAAEEQHARNERRGLFADAQAMNPRDFRKTNGPCDAK